MLFETNACWGQMKPFLMVGTTTVLWRGKAILICIRVILSIANVQMDCINPETMKEYFEMLKVVMTKHNFSTIQSNLQC